MITAGFVCILRLGELVSIHERGGINVGDDQRGRNQGLSSVGNPEEVKSPGYVREHSMVKSESMPQRLGPTVIILSPHHGGTDSETSQIVCFRRGQGVRAPGAARNPKYHPSKQKVSTVSIERVSSELVEALRQGSTTEGV